MFYKLTEKFTTLKIGGKMYKYSTDFRLFVLYNDTISTGKVSKELIAFLAQNKLPLIPQTIEVLNELYFSSEKSTKKEQKSKKSKNKASSKSSFTFRFSVLWELIYSAFVEKYNIDLCETEFLHFKKFSMLLNGLTGTSYNKVLIAWNANLSKVSKEDRAYYTELRKLYDLGRLRAAKYASLEERNEAMIKAVRKRFEEVKLIGDRNS